MKQVYALLTLVLCSALLCTSCMKEEKPYALPPAPGQDGDFKVKNDQVHMGETYDIQVFFSFETGTVASGRFQDWDISFTTGAENPELWMNGGKRVLIYPTGVKEYASVLDKHAATKVNRRYDNPTGLPGESGLGVLSPENHIGEVLIVDLGDGFLNKMQILEATATSYIIKTGALESTVGEEHILPKDEDYNFVFFSFEKGVVTVEPPKKDWDFVMTRYRHVYYQHNPDGSDELYPVNGLLTNSYQTTAAKDSIMKQDFYAITAEDAGSYTFFASRDVVGFDWKTPNINTGQYIVNSKKNFLVKDQKDRLWKLRFIDFYDDKNVKGSPKFEFQRIK